MQPQLAQPLQIKPSYDTPPAHAKSHVRKEGDIVTVAGTEYIVNSRGWRLKNPKVKAKMK